MQLLTSLPYCKVTNDRADNRIRLWLLGELLPYWEVWQRYGTREAYAALLGTVFDAISGLLTDEVIVYVCTDARAATAATLDVTTEVFSAWRPDRTLLARHERVARLPTAISGMDPRN